jgi:hypothetical protein
VQRLEERLKVAYAELDRVREASGAKPLRHTNLDTQGFAATQPMHPGM